MKLRMTLAALALLTIGLSSAAAYADTVTFTLTSPTEYVSPYTGGTLTFNATVSAPSSNGAAVYLNGDDFNIASPLALNDSDFLNFPFFLSPGTKFTGDLFTVTIPAGTMNGNYLGSFTLLGGADGGASNVLGTDSFDVVVTPEPSSILLSMTGMAGLVWAGCKRKVCAWVR
jgi:hypothetical protein